MERGNRRGLPQAEPVEPERMQVSGHGDKLRNAVENVSGEHRQTESSDRGESLVCETCNATFESIDDLNRHRREGHEGQVKAGQGSGSQAS